MSHIYQLNDEVRHRGQGPQGRVQVAGAKDLHHRPMHAGRVGRTS
jgi:hypothetical protein